MDASPNDAGDAVDAHRSFLFYRDFRYAKLALAASLAALLAYVLHDPLHGTRGGTWLGYTLGTIGAVLMAWLAWLGVRKRQYADGRGTARAWVSAHVYLGLALLVIVTLHTGLHFGFNLHTLAYALMCGVVASGLYGIAAYGLLPRRIAENRRDTPPGAMLAEIGRLDASALRLADRLGPKIHGIVTRSVANVRIGGSVWQQLSGRYAGRDDAGLRTLAEESRRKAAAPAAGAADPSATRMETVMFMADQLFESGRQRQADEVKRVLDLLTQRKALVERLNRDITLRARLNVWLYLHVPLTVALLAAVLAHVFVVFYYF